MSTVDVVLVVRGPQAGTVGERHYSRRLDSNDREALYPYEDGFLRWKVRRAAADSVTTLFSVPRDFGQYEVNSASEDKREELGELLKFYTSIKHFAPAVLGMWRVFVRGTPRCKLRYDDGNPIECEECARNAACDVRRAKALASFKQFVNENATLHTNRYGREYVSFTPTLACVAAGAELLMEGGGVRTIDELLDAAPCCEEQVNTLMASPGVMKAENYVSLHRAVQQIMAANLGSIDTKKVASAKALTPEEKQEKEVKRLAKRDERRVARARAREALWRQRRLQGLKTTTSNATVREFISAYRSGALTQRAFAAAVRAQCWYCARDLSDDDIVEAIG